MTNIEIAEKIVRDHKDYEKEGFSEYMNGIYNGILLGLEYIDKTKGFIRLNVRSEYVNEYLQKRHPNLSFCKKCGVTWNCCDTKSVFYAEGKGTFCNLYSLLGQLNLRRTRGLLYRNLCYAKKKSARIRRVNESFS